MSNARIRKYRAAIAAARMRGEASGDRTEMARAAIALADAEMAWVREALAESEAEVTRQYREAQQAEAQVARVVALVEGWERFPGWYGDRASQVRAALEGDA